MTFGLLITTAGQAAIATDLGGGTNLVLSHVAFGDASGVPYNPTVAQTALVNERYRATIAAVAVEANAIVVDAVLPADTDDASARDSHSFNVAEIGLFSSAGTLIGIARGSNGFKPGPATGQAVIATFRLKLSVSNPSAISVQIDVQQQIHIGRMVRPFFVVVEDILNTPPGAPAAGATYVIGASPTGAWAGFEHRLAQWVGVWALSTVPTGHLVVVNSRAVDHAERWLRKTATVWVSAQATDTVLGVARQATAAEVAARTPVSAFLTPDALDSIFITANITLTIIPAGGGDFTSLAAALDWLRRRIPLRGVTVTLSLAGGAHSITSDIVVDWHYGDQLRIIGAVMSGADPAGSDFAVTGYGPSQRTADATTNATMLRARYNTELELNGASLVITGGLGLLDDILLIRAGGTKSGLVIEDCAVTIGTVSVHGMEADGIRIEKQAVVTVNAVLSSSDSDGTGGQYDGIEMNDGSSLFGPTAAILAYGNAGPGIEMQHRSYMFAGTCRCHGNAFDGLRVFWSAHATVGNTALSQFSTNGEHGIELDVGGRFNSTGTAIAASSNFLSGVWANNDSFAFVPSLTATSNGRYGLEVLMASSADATNAGPSSNTLGAFFANLGSTIENSGGSGTASPAVNTDGNSNSIIRR